MFRQLTDRQIKYLYINIKGKHILFFIELRSHFYKACLHAAIQCGLFTMAFKEKYLGDVHS